MAIAWCAAGCHPSPVAAARRLVLDYNRHVTEAYRRGNVALVDTVVGPEEGRKIAGLIGVRSDLGLRLDSELLTLEILGVERSQDRLCITTFERWRYCDRRADNGLPLGEPSLDTYRMLYRFRPIDGLWRVDELHFLGAPQVGRRRTPWGASTRQVKSPSAPASAGSAHPPLTAATVPPDTPRRDPLRRDLGGSLAVTVREIKPLTEQRPPSFP